MPVVKKLFGQCMFEKALVTGVRESRNNFRWISAELNGVEIEVYCERSSPVKGQYVRLKIDEENGRYIALC